MEETRISDNYNEIVKQSQLLFQYLKNGKTDIFLEYIATLRNENIDVNMKDENNNTFVIFAIILNNRLALKKLIEYGGRLDVIDTNGNSILYYPIKLNYQEMIDMLVDVNNMSVGISLININDARGNTPIYYAIKYSNYYALQILLSNNADVEYKKNENTIHLAVMKKNARMVNMIVKYVSQINAKTSNGDTALHLACNYQLTDIVKILLQHRADPNIVNDNGYIPVFYSVIQNDISIVHEISKYGLNLRHQDILGNTLLHYAIMYDQAEIMEFVFSNYIIKKRAETAFTEYINNNYLANESQNDYIDPNIVNIDGLSILHILLYNYKPEYDKYIMKIIPVMNLNYQDNHGNTILHIMVENNVFMKYASILQNKKLNIFINNNNNETVMNMVPLLEREEFMNIIITSYLNLLKEHPDRYVGNWNNICDVNNDNSQISTSSSCHDTIRKFILKQKQSIPIKKNKLSVTIDMEETVHFSTFTGSQLDLLVGFKYLTQKYKNVASLFCPYPQKNVHFDFIKHESGKHIFYMELFWVYQKLYLPYKFIECMTDIINSAKYKYIIMPIGIILSNGNHSNCLFYDIEKNILERFEPHGSGYPYEFNYNPKLLDELLYTQFNSILSEIYNKKINIVYYDPDTYLPKIGFQIYENVEINYNKNIGDPNGFCALWCIWYLDYRLRHISEPPYKIVKKIITNIRLNNYSFRTIIRNYSKKITDIRDNYLISIGKNINDYINNKLTTNEKNILLNYILND